VKPFKLAAIRLIVPLIAALAMFCTQSIPVSNGGGSEVEVVGYVNFLDDGPASIFLTTVRPPPHR